jgi:hypothetical protein
VGYPNGQVDIPGLAKVGSNVTHSAESFDKAFSGHADALTPDSTFTGWSTGASVASATQAWSTFVKNLTGQVRAFGADLTTSSAAYESTDTAAAERVKQAGAGIPAGHPAWAGVHGQGPR